MKWRYFIVTVSCNTGSVSDSIGRYRARYAAEAINRAKAVLEARGYRPIDGALLYRARVDPNQW